MKKLFLITLLLSSMGFVYSQQLGVSYLGAAISNGLVDSYTNAVDVKNNNGNTLALSVKQLSQTPNAVFTVNFTTAEDAHVLGVSFSETSQESFNVQITGDDGVMVLNKNISKAGERLFLGDLLKNNYTVQVKAISDGSAKAYLLSHVAK